LHFFDKFELETLYCEPSLFNIPANKILAQLGFELLSANRALVTRLEHGKAINQWRLHRSALNKLVH
jgi:RimJ/RimL family protein N-acetyltransferase